MTVEVVHSSVVDSLDPPVRTELDASLRIVANRLTDWVNSARAASNRGLFERNAYAVPQNPYDQMRAAARAVDEDDVVGGLAEVTEGLALDGVKWEGIDADETDVFNQMAAKQDLDAVIRRMWREEFTQSQCVLGFWWGTEEFTVRGKTEQGKRKKKKMAVHYPQAITTLDSTKVVPVGMLHFGQERLAWQATTPEIGQYSQVLNGMLMDEMMVRFYAGQYIPSDAIEQMELSQLRVDINRLILLDDRVVKRHTLTKSDHKRFADVRLKRIFKLLDLKQQLLDADRVSLIGAANYILLVRKGDKDEPAYPEEIANLKQNFNYIAKLPVIISDHRLQIDIITPKQDYTLDEGKYNTLDNRIIASVLGLFGAMGASSGNRSDNSLQQARLVARGMENRRHLLRRFLEREIAQAVVNHPRNAGVFDGPPPSLAFVPANIQLDNDSGVAAQVFALRQSNELSRETTLEWFGFDQEVEAMRRELEQASGLDDTFQTRVPFSAADGGAQPDNSGPVPRGTNGRDGSGSHGTPQSGRGNRGQGGTPPAAQASQGARGGRPRGGGRPNANPGKVT